MCGIVGVVRQEPVTGLNLRLILKILLEELQHRGHDSAGITIIDNYFKLTGIKRVGAVTEAISRGWVYDALRYLELAGIGHVRYPTYGSALALDETNLLFVDSPENENPSNPPKMVNAQPFYKVIKDQNGKFIEGFALVHNGEIINSERIKEKLKNKGHKFHGTTDSEVILCLLYHLIRCKNLEPVEAIRLAMTILRGSYSCIFITPEKTYAFKDPYANRPLDIASLEIEGEKLWILASESCAWHKLQAKHYHTIQPGEIVEFTPGTRHLPKCYPMDLKLLPQYLGLCLFCPYYLQALRSKNNRRIRKGLGRELFKIWPRKGLVVPIPNSGIGAAEGYHDAQVSYYSERGIARMVSAIIKDPTVGRSFLEPDQEARKIKNRIKYVLGFDQYEDIILFLAENEEYIHIILVDDSLLRGNVSGILIEIIRQHLKYHFPELYEANRFKLVWLSSAPPYIFPCNLGVNTAQQDELVAYLWLRDEKKIIRPTMADILDLTNVDQYQLSQFVCKTIRADEMVYLPLQPALEIAAKNISFGSKMDKINEGDYSHVHQKDFCAGCFTGYFPIIDDVTDEMIDSVID